MVAFADAGMVALTGSSSASRQPFGGAKRASRVAKVLDHVESEQIAVP